MKTIKFSCTDAELSAAVALHVAGWTTDPVLLKFKWHPEYAVDVNALIPLLEKFPGVLSDFESHQGPNQKWKVTIMISNENFVVDYGATFARAACFALLRAAGVEIVP